MLQKLKSWLLPHGNHPRTVPVGLFRGLRLRLDFAFQSQIYGGLWERETYAFARSRLPGCQTAVDVGACRGEFTLLFLSQPAMRRVIAVEPWPPNLAMLHDNLDLNQRRSDARLSICTKKLGASPADDATTLDELDVPPDGNIFIKIDVDGGEMDVLRGGMRLLSRPGVTLLVETHSPQLEEDCLSCLRSLGYQCQIIRNAWWRALIPENRPLGHNRWLGAVR